jgi:8-oxo-dGTP diphosphatase
VNDEIHVVAGIVRDEAGRVLLTQIPPGKHLAGAWEFPGGKCEPGEPPEIALARELHEELGIDVQSLERLISIPWRYAEKTIRLDAYRILRYAGEPSSREGQALRWCNPENPGDVTMPDADRPIVTALRLPVFYAITPEPGDNDTKFLGAFERTIASGVKLIQLRIKHSIESRRELIIAARDIAHSVGAKLLLNSDVHVVRDLGLDGVHLPASDLLKLSARPLDRNHWVAASCHDEHELEHAAKIGVDFVVLGSIFPTPSHPSVPLGWKAFSNFCHRTALPVFALGGVRKDDLSEARSQGAVGIAGIRTFWTD